MQKAIIHSETRVIVSLTTDENPVVNESYEVVLLDKPIDIGGGYWKLTANNKKIKASAEEAIVSGADQVGKYMLKKANIKNAINLIINDSSVSSSIKEYFKIINK